MWAKLIVTFLLAVSILAAAGCEKKPRPATRPAPTTQSAADKAKEAARSAGEAAGEGMEAAGQAAEQAGRAVQTRAATAPAE